MSTSADPTRRESVFEQLRSWILSGALAPGQRLPVRDIAQGLGLSTMPVRHALVRLEEAGLVTQEPNKGARVNKLSVDDLKDFYDLRRLIEPPSIQMGIERVTPERLSRMRDVLRSLVGAAEGGDLVRVLDLDEELLDLVHVAVVNRQLARVIRQTWAQVRPYKLLFTMTQADAGDYLAAVDTQLLRLAESGDAVGAREFIDSSLVKAHLRLDDLLRSYQEGVLSAPRHVSPPADEPLSALISRLAGASSR